MKIPHEKQKIFLAVLPVTAIALIIFGVHLEYSGDTTLPLFYRGLLNDTVVKTTYIYELFWGEFFSYAYALYPEFPFHGLLLLLFSGLAVGISFFPVIGFVQNVQTTALWKILLLLSLTSLLLIHVMWLDVTRIPLLIGVAVPLIFLNTPTAKVSSIFLLLLWVAAYWIRPESGQVAIIMLLPSLALALFTDLNRYRRAALLWLLGVALAFGTSVLHLSFYQNEDAKAMRTLYDLHFAFFDAYHRNVALSAISPANEARYEAMLVDFQSDKDSLSISHYQSFVDGKAFSLDALRQLPERLNRVAIFIRLLSGQNKGCMLLYFTVLFCCLLMLSNWRKSLKLILHQGYCWGCIVAIVFFVKAAERTYEPMITVAALIALADLRRMYAGHHPFILQMGMYPLFLVFLFGSFQWMDTCHAKSSWYKEMAKQNHQNLTVIVAWQKQHNNMLFSIDALELMNIGPLREFHVEQIYFYLHDAHINYFPGMDEALAKKFGSPSLKQFYSVAADRNMLLLCTKKRMAIIQNYLDKVHDLNLKCTIIQSYPIWKVSGSKEQLHVYQFSKLNND
jgi:hypothetical protein